MLLCCRKLFETFEYIFTQSELLEPVLAQAAWLGIHFFYFFHYTQLEMHILEGPDYGQFTSEGK